MSLVSVCRGAHQALFRGMLRPSGAPRVAPTTTTHRCSLRATRSAAASATPCRRAARPRSTSPGSMPRGCSIDRPFTRWRDDRQSPRTLVYNRSRSFKSSQFFQVLPTPSTLPGPPAQSTYRFGAVRSDQTRALSRSQNADGKGSPFFQRLSHGDVHYLERNNSSAPRLLV
jgi:hypothetical protein